MTNADRIRSMTDEELAELIDDSKGFFSCDECEKPWEERSSLGCEDCKVWILFYLRSESNG